jgi:hypothetical protein
LGLGSEVQGLAFRVSPLYGLLPSARRAIQPPADTPTYEQVISMSVQSHWFPQKHDRPKTHSEEHIPRRKWQGADSKNRSQE